jgi:flagellar biogenesis protein FliO
VNGCLRHARIALGSFVCAAASLPCVAQETLAQLGLREPDADLPGIGRVVLVLVFTLAVAVAAIYAIRRFWPQPLGQRSGTARLSAQLAVSSSLKLHFVDVDGATLVVAEGRGGVAIAELEKRAPRGAAPEVSEHAGR